MKFVMLQSILHLSLCNISYLCLIM